MSVLIYLCRSYHRNIYIYIYIYCDGNMCIEINTHKRGRIFAFIQCLINCFESPKIMTLDLRSVQNTESIEIYKDIHIGNNQCQYNSFILPSFKTKLKYLTSIQ
jgi:hypothetical protein